MRKRRDSDRAARRERAVTTTPTRRPASREPDRAAFLAEVAEAEAEVERGGLPSFTSVKELRAYLERDAK